MVNVREGRVFALTSSFVRAKMSVGSFGPLDVNFSLINTPKV